MKTRRPLTGQEKYGEFITVHELLSEVRRKVHGNVVTEDYQKKVTTKLKRHQKNKK